MLKIERQNYILSELQKNGSILVPDLSAALNCHPETIRRDLKELENDGKLIRIYGGAYLPDYSDLSVPTDLRSSLYKEEKIAMSAIAARHVFPGATIILDSSTTCLQLAQILLDSEIPLTIITNSLRICNLFDINTAHQIKIECTGGSFRQKTSSFIGYAATHSLETTYADISFISAPAIDKEFGLSDLSLNESRIRSTMLAHSKKHICLMDHTKFSKVAKKIIAPLEAIDILITDQVLDSDWSACLLQHNVTVEYTNQ